MLVSNQQPPRLATDAQALAGAIFTPQPVSWNQSTVIRPGFVSHHTLNESLFESFQELPNVQGLTGISSNYYVQTPLGSAGSAPQNASDVYQVTRYAAFNGSLVAVEVVVWLE